MRSLALASLLLVSAGCSGQTDGTTPGTDAATPAPDAASAATDAAAGDALGAGGSPGSDGRLAADSGGGPPDGRTPGEGSTPDGRAPSDGSTSPPDGRAPADAPTGAAPTGCGPFDFAAVTAAMERLVGNGAIPGAGLVIVRAGCPTLYERAFGKYTLDTVEELASASKLPGATLLMTLVDQGKLRLDDPVGRHLPYWPEDKKAITIRQLLSHTSGLPGQAACLGDKGGTLDDCAQKIAKQRLIAPPGTELNYGGTSFHVAGAVAEAVGGKPWNTLWKELVTAPCNLPTLSYAAGPENTTGSDTNPRIAGGAASNLRDYGGLLGLHLSGGVCGDKRVLSEASVKEMRRDQIGNATIGTSPYQDGRHYGLGLWAEPAPGGGPTTAWSDQGAFGATPWIETAHGYGAFLLIKTRLADGTAIFKEVKPLIDAALRAR